MQAIPPIFQERIREAKAKKLKALDLYPRKLGERLDAVPVEIFDLEWLENLDLGNHDLQELPSDFTRLSNLKSLNVSRNRLNTLPESLGQLNNLTSLNVSRNQLNTLPTSFRQMNLMSLDVSSNQMRMLPEWLGQMRNLTSLNVSGNQLNSLPNTLGQLHNLSDLNISYNLLNTLPNSVAQLTNLVNFNLKSNKFAEFPRQILKLPRLQSLNITENPIITPPPEIIAVNSSGNVNLERIKDYYRQLDTEGVDYLYEAKLLLVGEGGAGKTTLARKIVNLNYELENEPSTKGIDVVQWVFSFDGKHIFRVNIWDFGGQEIYHTTHQFFLTKRSLYLLVADTRKEDTDFYYWLNVVELLSDNSPLLIVKNEKQDRHREIDEQQLRGQFTSLKETLATNLANNRGLPQILQSIQHYIRNLPHVGTPLPKTWVKVREQLENDPRNYVGLDEYLSICQQNGFTQLKDKLQLSDYLHDLGVCLHFQNDALLKKTVILKPSWGTAAVYKVLDNPQVIRNLGRFNRKDLAVIWKEETYTNMHDELLQLMINFKLCYKIPDSDLYIAPQLLTTNKPDYTWDKNDNLLMRYTYEFMPKGIITRFIVEMHRWIVNDYVWKSGILLETEDTNAEIIEHYGKREIHIRIVGKHKRYLMTILSHELDKIHNSFRRLRYDKLIPCNCDDCKKIPDPYFYRWDVLQNAIATQQREIQCQKYFKMVDVGILVGDIIDRKQLQMLGSKLEPSTDFEGAVFNAPVEINIQTTTKGKNIVSKNENPTDQSFVLIINLFWLFAAVIVMALLGALSNLVSWPAFILILIAGPVLLSILGAFSLRQNKQLSEKNFVQLMGMTFEQLPLIGQLAKLFKGRA
jgi:internalin A